MLKFALVYKDLSDLENLSELEKKDKRICLKSLEHYLDL